MKCAPREFFEGESLEGNSSESESLGSESFADALWKAADENDLIEAAPQAFLTGKMLMDLGVKPGKQMGEIIKQSFELQLDGKITSVEDAINWAKQR